MIVYYAGKLITEASRYSFPLSFEIREMIPSSPIPTDVLHCTE